MGDIDQLPQGLLSVRSERRDRGSTISRHAQKVDKMYQVTLIPGHDGAAWGFADMFSLASYSIASRSWPGKSKRRNGPQGSRETFDAQQTLDEVKPTILKVAGEPLRDSDRMYEYIVNVGYINDRDL